MVVVEAKLRQSERMLLLQFLVFIITFNFLFKFSCHAEDIGIGDFENDTYGTHLIKEGDRNFFIEYTNVGGDHHNDTESSATELDQLLITLEENGYDYRLRPHLGGRAVEVSCAVYIGQIQHISEATMDFTIDFYMRQAWDDYRLSWNSSAKEAISIADDHFQDVVWIPDTTFTNVKMAELHQVTRFNGFLRVSPHGHVKSSTRIKLTASCPMDLTEFPMDEQNCPLYIESFSSTDIDVIYLWKRQAGDRNSPISHTAIEFNANQLTKLNTFIVMGFMVDEEISPSYDEFNRSRLTLRIFFRRNVGYYVIQVYIPAFLMVVCSWFSFWLPRESTPARVTLGITTILVCITLNSQQFQYMPKISKLKAMDVYMFACFASVFFALLEYAIVSYSLSAASRLESMLVQNQCKNDNKLALVGMSLMQNFQGKFNTMMLAFGKRSFAAKLDIFSRFFFPFTFLSFNFSYWYYFLYYHQSHTTQVPGFIPLH